MKSVEGVRVRRDTAAPERDAGHRRRLVLLDEDDRETALFFLRWLREPTRIGAIAPSSRQLGRAMARQVTALGTDPVIELGGGTGSVTRALLEAGIAPERLVVVERDERLFRILQQRFPSVRVVRGDARTLRRLLAPLGVRKAAAIVSCLPLISMPRRTCLRIVAESFALLGEGRPLVQFTYGLTSPLARERLGLKGRITARIWANLPPASVWRYERPRHRHELPQVA
ncbi:MAG TPA: rRNA adenine N-6-methyltransferase family protein [Stellaceae bacterium]|nr:rRNA adenine N-6-methyltransferase family protein [Stellaceae bacterium]